MLKQSGVLFKSSSYFVKRLRGLGDVARIVNSPGHCFARPALSAVSGKEGLGRFNVLW